MSLHVPELSPNVSVLIAAIAYARAGWHVVPVRAGTKNPGSVLGDDWQHKSSRDPELIAAWWAGTGHGIALHAGRSGAVIFDVDHPDRIPETLQKAVSDCRPPFQSTRTDVPGKGHQVFAMPEGRVLGNGAGRLGGAFGDVRGANGVIVVAPSVHPEAANGGRYAWDRFGPVPVLPDYVADLLNDAFPAEDAATDTEVEAFLSEHAGGTRPELLTGWCSTFNAKVAAGESRHQRMISIAAGAMKEAAAGYFPARDAAKRLHDAFIPAVARPPQPGTLQRDPRTGGIAEAEWVGILAWAVAQARAADPGQTRARVNKQMPKVDPATGEVLDDTAEDTFWTARDELKLIRQFARAQLASPWAVLTGVLARVVCQVPPAIVLPDIIYGPASLNLTIALVAPSGGGKGGSTIVARYAVDIGSPEFQTHTLGTGQGIAHGYARWNAKEKVVEPIATSVLFTVEEVDHLAAHNNQNGSTTLAELRRFSMGEKLGHLYVDPTRRIQVPAHSYRGAFIVGVQPARGGVLLDAIEGGTPQRFLWAPTIDRTAPDEPPERPKPFKWQPPRERLKPDVLTGLSPIPVCSTATEAIRQGQRDRNAGRGDPLDGHALLTRERVAAALGVLHGHYGITEEDWALAGTVMTVSDATRAAVTAALAAKTTEVNRQRAESEAARTLIIGDRVEEEATQRVARAIMRILLARNDWVARAELRKAINSRDRGRFDEVIERLISAGQIEADETSHGTLYRIKEGTR